MGKSPENREIGLKHFLIGKLLVVAVFLLAGFLFGLSWLAIPATASSAQSTPTPDRLAQPTLPANPGQADLGAVDYWFSCMVCHGDLGQGLTEEWRAASGPEDMNCWQSRCHASNHPKEGFVLPPYAPRLIGQGALGRFYSALDLQAYISQQMPWQAPGVLDDNAYWQQTAFLLRENGILLSDSLGPANADRVLLRAEQQFNQDAPETTEEPADLAVTATPTSYLEDSGTVVESVLPLWALMLVFGCILLLASIGWPLIIARRRLQEPEEEENKYSRPY